MAETYFNGCHPPDKRIRRKISPFGAAGEWLDLKTLTQYASVSERTMREWIHRSTNPLPAVQVGTKILVRRSEFDRWLENHRVEPVDVSCIVDEMVSELAGSH